jgi:hypothetical protein
MIIIAKSAVRATEKVLAGPTMGGIETRAQYQDGKPVAMVLRAWEEGTGREINIIFPMKEAGAALVAVSSFMRDFLNTNLKET